jgi:type II secretory pathway pseudopilin PulG
VKLFAAQLRKAATGGPMPARQRRQEEGYILLTMLLVVALMAILALAVITEMKFTMQRDQEQEMIHRGVQYSRAVRGYYKKFGRYPTRLEELENTNNLRYLRKRYKDPINKNQDFRLLHFGEQGVTVGTGGISFGGGTIPGANAIGSPGGTNGPGNSAFGGSTFGNSGSGVNNSGVFAQSSGFGGNSNSAFGANSNPSTTGGNAPGTNPSNTADSSSSTANSQDASTTTTKISAAGASDQSSGQQAVGGGPIVGVASLSKKTTIREFNKKRKYNEWQFIYDPTTEPRSGLITTPNQPLAQGFGSQPLNGTQPGSTTASPFGQSSGFGNNSNTNTPSAPTQTPSNPPPQQQ